MKYPKLCTNIIDVTKPPYCADNTGKVDCTAILRQVMDDVLIRHVEETEKFAAQLRELSENGQYDVYVGFEAGKVVDGQLRITMPDNEPTTKIIYFPAGTYLVSDTVTYTLTNLKNKYYVCPDYDLSRNIHFLGENRETTVLRLADNAPGFELGSVKPLLSFNTNPAPRDVEVSNTCQMNMLEDLTLDMGKGNGGVGVRYHSSNNGRIENVTIRSECGTAGVYTVFGAEASFANLTISGFDYGMDIAWSQLLTIDNVDVSGNRIAGIVTNDSVVSVLQMDTGTLPAVTFREGKTGRYYLADPALQADDPKGNFVYREKPGLQRPAFPKNPFQTFDDYAFVDDFGAVPDGKTDASRAIRKAFASGKPVVLFGEGEYCINEPIPVPATVRYIDFNYCSLASGPRLIGGEADCAFEIAEDAAQPLFISHLYAGEHFYGHMRMLKQSCVRDVVLKDLEPCMACLYFNTVPGSRVFLDNIFLTTGTYSQNRVLVRKNLLPVYSRNIPLELHGQTVIGRGVNLERADVALLNDGSAVLLDGFRTEGPGTAVKTVNGGKTEIHLFNAGIGSKWAENPLFEVENAALSLTGALACGYNKDSEYNILVKDTQGDRENVLAWDDADTTRDVFSAIIHSYTGGEL